MMSRVTMCVATGSACYVSLSTFFFRCRTLIPCALYFYPYFPSESSLFSPPAHVCSECCVVCSFCAIHASVRSALGPSFDSGSGVWLQSGHAPRTLHFTGGYLRCYGRALETSEHCAGFNLMF
ncbi:hypothetical protein B0H17DRAFT_298029 [Mycena rosella]|uniref:Uncharacterized protein n=1 Tax=Mycena rosella TaxID=1033263 RepID=A0AAD7GNS7_MYCRO|nr:hypothetical protein B0H17DRAFT_298029 [Mycena rosella]